MKIYQKADIITNVLFEKSLFKETPKGVVFHWTASGDSKGTIRYLKTTNLGYHIIIDRDGSVTQTCLLDHVCYHAGKSAWRGMSSLNNIFLGVALANWGALSQKNNSFFSWPSNYSNALGNETNIFTINGKSYEGVYPKQMTSLIHLCRWFVANGIPLANIVGHDEVSPGRKIDIGMLLGMSISEFREFLSHLIQLPE